MDRPSSLGLVLDEIRQSGPIARIHLASEVGLSTAAVSKLTAQLIEYGVVRESGYSESSAGRRPILLALNSDAYSVIGVDLNWQGLRGAIVDLEGQILAERSSAWNLQEQHEVSEVAEAVAALALKLLTSRGVVRERVLGLGLVGPGPVSWPAGRMVALPLPSVAMPANSSTQFAGGSGNAVGMSCVRRLWKVALTAALASSGVILPASINSTMSTRSLLRVLARSVHGKVYAWTFSANC